MAVAGSGERIASTPLFGRTEIVEEFDRLLERAAAGSGQGLLLSGTGGSGKSHVLQAVRARAAEKGWRVLSGRALPEELPPPFSLVRDILGSIGEEEATEGSGPAPPPIFFAPFAVAQPETGTEPKRGGRATSAQEDLDRILAPFGRGAVEGLGAGREVLLGRIADYFRTLASERPLLVTVDDLQLADVSSLEFLDRFARDLPTMSAIVVVTLDTSAEVPERIRAAFRSLRGPSFHAMTVRPLTVPEATEFVRWILGGRSADARDVLRWHAQTEGNPLFLEQLVRTGIGLGPAANRTVETEGSRNVTEILLSRLRSLGESERRVLTYAAVLGKEFTFADLSAVAGLGEERVTEGLDHLVQNGLVREKGREVYEFVSEAVRTSVYADLTETRRRILHLKAGRALEAQGGERESELARQFYLGRDNDRAVKYNVAAADTAIRAFAFETAVAHLARALEAERRRPKRDPRVEIRLLTDEGRLLSEMGSLRQAEEILGDAVRLARSEAGRDLELGRALLGLADTEANRGEYLDAEKLAAEAGTLLKAHGTRHDLMACHRVLGMVYWRRGELGQAEIQQRSALEIAEQEGSPLELGHALVDLAISISPQERTRLEAALEMLSRAADLFGKVEDYSARARVLMDRAVTERQAGRDEDALRDIALAVEAAERSRSPIWIGYCYLNLAQWQAAMGNPDVAHSSLGRAIQALAGSGDRLGDEQIELTRGMIAQAEGAYDTAEVSFQEALSQARALHLGTDQLEVMVRMAELSHARGDEAQAAERVREIRESGLIDLRADLREAIAALERRLPHSATPPPP
jgi:predicted ATPase